MKEKRRYRRIDKSFLTRLKIMPSKLNKLKEAFWDLITTRNLSVGGLLFNYYKEVPVGAEVELKIVFPLADRPIECIGKVIRSQKIIDNGVKSAYRIAAQFDDIKEQDKISINGSVLFYDDENAA